MKLTKEEKAWLKKANALLAQCPTRLTFYAGGDCHVAIIDGDHAEEINATHGDPVVIAQRNGWLADEMLMFPTPVNAVCF